MRTKLMSLLLLFGAVLGAVKSELIPVPSVVVAILGGFILGMSYILFSSVYSGNVWGITVKSTGTAKLIVLLTGAGVLLGGYALVIAGLTAFVALTRFDLVSLAVNAIGFLIPLAIGPFVGKKIAENVTSKGKNAMVFDTLPLFKEIEGNLENAVTFVVGFEGVALYSGTNYCYAVYRYTDFELGELTTPREVALIGTYFVQKYHEKFTFKVDVEVIPGQPGQTVVAVGAGGIGVARIQGTPDKRIFRSYIFTRKK